MPLINDYDNWFEWETDPNDPTRVTARRLTPDEAKAAHAKQVYEWLRQYFPEAFVDFEQAVHELVDNINKIADSLPADPKAEARQRSREDLQQKRRAMMKRRGRK